MMTVLRRKSDRPGRRLAAACVLAACLGGLVLSAAPVPIRLVGVSAQPAGRNAALLIEATEPVAYAVSRPDPLTLLVDMRNVSVADAAPRVAATGPIARVSVEQDTTIDGKALARVRVALASPSTYAVHSARNVIRLDVEPTRDPLPLDAAPAASAHVALPAADDADVPAATWLDKVRAHHTRTSTTITFSGNGRLTPSSLTEPDEQPRRLVLDFPNLDSHAPAQTNVEGVFVNKVRVAVNSRDPLVTRAVLEIAPTATYHVERTGAGGRDLSLVFEGQKPGGTIMVAPPTAEDTANLPGADSTAAAKSDPSAKSAPSSTSSSAAADDGDTMTVEQAMANVASITPPDPMSALVLPPAADAKPQTAQMPQPASNPRKPQDPPHPQSLADAQKAQSADPRDPRQQPPAKPATPPRPSTQPPAQPTLTQQVPGTGAKHYTGAPISMDFEDSDLRSVLRVFSETSGLNIIIDPSVQGRVNMVLNDVPWDQAMETILKVNKLGYTVEGNIVRIAPLSVLQDEQSQQAKLKDARALAGELVVQTYPLSYAKADALSPILLKAVPISARGQIQTDTRTNTLIITDLPDRLQTAAQLISTLDKPEPQVEVEARIVQTSRDFARAIGVQWGFNGRADQQIGNTTGLAFPNTVNVGGRVGGTQGSNDPRGGTANGNVGTAVNLGAAGASSAVGLALGSINGAFNLDVALTALENTGKGRILSTPRLTTQNNQEAEVAQGVEIPIQTVANNTVAVSFKQAVLSLKVTPQITAANTVIMNITVENATPDFSRQVNGIPPVDTQRAITRVQVTDGATTVIGGIFVSQEQSSNDRTPLLHRIPLLGWLFRRDTLNDSSRELLIFITPRIMRG